MILIIALLLALPHHPLKSEHRVLKLSLRQNGFCLWDHRANCRHVTSFADEVDFESLETFAGSLDERNKFLFLKIKRLLRYFIQTFGLVCLGILELIQVDCVETACGQHIDIIQTRDRELNLLNLGC